MNNLVLNTDRFNWYARLENNEYTPTAAYMIAYIDSYTRIYVMYDIVANDIFYTSDEYAFAVNNRLCAAISNDRNLQHQTWSQKVLIRAVKNRRIERKTTIIMALHPRSKTHQALRNIDILKMIVVHL